MVLSRNNWPWERDLNCSLVNPIGETLYSFQGRNKTHLEVSHQRSISREIKTNEIEQHAEELETFVWEQTFSFKENTFLRQLFAFRMEQKIISNMWVLLWWKSQFLCKSNWATCH